MQSDRKSFFRPNQHSGHTGCLGPENNKSHLQSYSNRKNFLSQNFYVTSFLIKSGSTLTTFPKSFLLYSVNFSYEIVSKSTSTPFDGKQCCWACWCLVPVVRHVTSIIIIFSSSNMIAESIRQTCYRKITTSLYICSIRINSQGTASKHRWINSFFRNKPL